MLCVYQVLMGGIELLKDLVHDGVGEIGNHWQLYFSAEDWVRGKGETDGKKLGKSESKSIFFLSNSDLLLLLQRLTYSKALWMSCAALSIRAVRMAERGMDTRSETDERGGLNLSAAEEDRGQSSRHRDTMESTITCNGCQRSVTVICYISVSKKEAARCTCSSLSAALASSPAKESSLCRTGPSTDSTWASSHSEG